jgi:hypothetical protein
VFRAEEFAIASAAAAELSGRKHRVGMVRVVPRCEKLSDFFARRPLISINAKSRFGDLTWKTARADYVNPTPWVAFKQLARFVNDSDPLGQRVESIFFARKS